MSTTGSFWAELLSLTTPEEHIVSAAELAGRARTMRVSALAARLERQAQTELLFAIAKNGVIAATIKYEECEEPS